MTKAPSQNSLPRLLATLLPLSCLLCLPLQSASAPTQDPADPHLVGWWRFDETSGTKAGDSSPHGRTATLEGTLSFDANSVPGRLGSALEFDGKTAVARVPGFKGVTGTSPRTVAAWIKTTSRSGNIVTWGFNDAGKMWNFGFIRSRIGVSPKGGYLYMNEPTNDGEWHHVAVVVAEASPPNLHDHVTLYKDGEPAEIHDIGLLDLWPIDTGAELDVSIGPRFQGAIDDLRIYDRPLSDEEIKTLFNLANTAPKTP